MFFFLIIIFLNYDLSVKVKKSPPKRIRQIELKIDHRKRSGYDIEKINYPQIFPLDLRVAHKKVDNNGMPMDSLEVVTKTIEVNASESALRNNTDNEIFHKNESVMINNSDTNIAKNMNDTSSYFKKYEIIVISIKNEPVTITNKEELWLLKLYDKINKNEFELKLEFNKIINICTKSGIKRRLYNGNSYMFIEGMCNFIKLFIDFDYLSLVKDDLLSIRIKKRAGFNDKTSKVICILKKFLELNKKRAFGFLGNMRNFPRCFEHQKYTRFTKKIIKSMIEELCSQLGKKSEIFKEIVNELNEYELIIYDISYRETLLFLYVLHAKNIFDLELDRLFYDEGKNMLLIKSKETNINNEFDICTLKMLFYNLIFKKNNKSLAKHTMHFLKHFILKLNYVNPTIFSELEINEFIRYLDAKRTKNYFLSANLTYLSEFDDFIYKYNLIIDEFLK